MAGLSELLGVFLIATIVTQIAFILAVGFIATRLLRVCHFLEESDPEALERFKQRYPEGGAFAKGLGFTKANMIFIGIACVLFIGTAWTAYELKASEFERTRVRLEALERAIPPAVQGALSPASAREDP